MTTRSRIAGLSALTTLAACAAIAAPASADTTVMGSALTLPYQGGVDTSSGTNTIQTSQAGGSLPNPIVSPGNGIITDWKVRSGDPDTLYTLRVFTPSTMAANTFTASGGVAAPAPIPPGTVDAIFTYPGNSLPIKQGDHIGLLQTGTPDVGIAQNTTGGIPLNVIANKFATSPADGVPTAFIPDQQHELLLQATVKYCKVPNLVGQAEAATTPLLVAADCTGTVTTKPTANASEVGKVISQDPAPNATGIPGTAVKLEVGVATKGCKKKAKKKGKKGSASAAAKKKKKGGCKKPKKKSKKK
jgi:hypothetical protein